VRLFGASAPKTGLSASIFFAADSKKGFPLQSLARAQRLTYTINANPQNLPGVVSRLRRT
jgi:hypothetical protein